MSEQNISEQFEIADITDTMRNSYLEYAMSVIIGRALPDVRDGLKPVHRRILYAMHLLNLYSNRSYVKSARVVGDVIGKFHPHGESAVYDALVRLAQDFSLRFPLIEGQGNFGSIDGDSAAAMRYTEVRLEKLSSEMLGDIEKNTVDFQENYDASITEPVVLPTKLPSLLMNGSSGIAVGMATNIPPHNLGELVDGIIYLIDNPKDFTLSKLMEYIPAPDFPTGGQILNKQGIFSAYSTGHGVIKIRGKSNFEEVRNRQAIVITEIPYGVNKARMIEKIASLTAEKKIVEIYDIRDESDRHGTRVVIELKKGAIAESILNQLYSLTQFQSSFGINMLAVANKQPKVMNLPTILQYFIKHRKDVITRKTRYLLKKAKERHHILEGLIIALNNINEVISVIKKSSDSKIANQQLQEKFNLSINQSKSVLEMRLQRLTGLEIKKIYEEQKELLEKIRHYTEILEKPQTLTKILKTELIEIKDKYSNDRKTEITDDLGSVEYEDMIKPELFVITLSKNGYIKRTTLEQFRPQHRGGKGKIGMKTSEEDIVDQIIVAMSLDDLMLFSSKGRIFWKKVYEIPQTSPAAKGRAIVNFIGLDKDEKIVSWLKCSKKQKNDEKLHVIMVTAKGKIKKTRFIDFKTRTSHGTKSIQLNESDSVVSVKFSENNENIFIATRNGMATMFKANSVRSQGRVTRGSRGIRLKRSDDFVVCLEIVDENDTILTISEKGFGKRSKIKNYRLGSRGNSGVINMKVTPKTGPVIKSLLCKKNDQVVIISELGGTIRLEVGAIRKIGRATQGVKLINLDKSDRVTSVSIVNYDELI